ncbi:MAG: twin-arginine translocase subunit TatC [Candidatus Thermoplasmatota archaeon]|nr:twin-arginine translocase subunit TatC [Candidatus Thermoplasmatota archaeon]
MARRLILIGAVATALMGLLLWGAARVSRRASELQDEEMGLLDHLREMRFRALASLAAVTVATVALFSFDVRYGTLAGYTTWYPVPSVTDSLASRLLSYILQTSLPEGVGIVVLNPSEAIVAQLQAAVLGGLVLAAPVVAYQVAAFVAPALKTEERRFVALLAPLAGGLFLAGIAFGFWIMVPVTLRTLYAYAGTFGAEALARPQETLGFILLTSGLFGVAFELPLIMAGLSYAGLVHPDTMGRHWRGVVVAILIIGAVLSDPSPLTQVLIAGPVVVLYLAGLGAARMTWRMGGHARPRS